MSDPNVHPSDWELAGLADGTLDGIESERVRDHIESCVRCRDRIGRDRGPFDVDAERFLVALADEERRPAVAGWLQTALATHHQPIPRAGQIWQLIGDDSATLALVYKVADERAYVVPVTLETELADEYTIVVDEQHSPVDASLALWVRLSALVDKRILAAHVADSDLDHDVQVVRDDFVHGRATESIRTGQPVADVLDPRWHYRDHLKATFASLSAPPADVTSQPTEYPTTAAASDTHVDDDVIRAVRAEIEYAAPQALVLADPEATVLDTVAQPLRPVLIVMLADLRLRVALDPSPGHADQADGADRAETAEAANLLGLLGDCDRLAIVHTGDEFSTRLLDPYDLNESFETPSGTRRRARLVDPEPLGLVFGRLQQDYVAPHGMFANVELDKIDVDLSSVIGAAALEALHDQAGRAWKGEKKDEFEKLSENDAAAIAAFVKDSHKRTVADYHDEYDVLVAGRAA